MPFASLLLQLSTPLQWHPECFRLPPVQMKEKQGSYTFSFERGCFEPKDFLFNDIDSDSPFGAAVRRVLLLLLKHSKITIDEQTKKDLGI